MGTHCPSTFYQGIFTTRATKLLDMPPVLYFPCYSLVLFSCSQTRTSIQGTPGVKFTLAKTKMFWSKMIFEQNQKKFLEQNFGKFFFFFWKIKIWKKILDKKIQFFFSTSSTIPSEHPVQISSCSDYCISTDLMWNTPKMLKIGVWSLL